ncbi:MAG: alpha/beta hydrolase [Alphaproteobacteria bacterium]|nr:alpha/beta hydrolase [Alphaproteobacteria bacterium]
MRWAAAFAPLAGLVAAACSPVGVLNAMAPEEGIVREADMAYGPLARQHLDVYAPAPPLTAGRKYPVIVFFYGGGWENGDRAIYRFLGQTLAACGVVTVIPDYRVYPEVTFPVFMEDAARAVAWAREHIATVGGDPDRLFLMGHSAGAQIATLLALDRDYLKAAGMSASVAGVIGLAGPYDFLPLESTTLKAIFGPESEWKRSQPIDYVAPGAPPMLLLTGSDDTTVDPGNTRRLAARLRAAGNSVTAAVYPQIGHEMLIGAIARPLTFLAPARRDVLDFIAAPAGACE